MFFRSFFWLPVLLSASLLNSAEDSTATAAMARLTTEWQSPARTYKPHTRWWWPGNALTEADITWQLEQMAAQGMGGVEIMSTWKMYEKGNHDYLSPEFLALVRHAVDEAKRLNLEVAISFGPGWSFGGQWVTQEDQSKGMVMESVTVAGGTHFDGPVPVTDDKGKEGGKGEHKSNVPGKLLAVVAGRVERKNQLDANSLTVITGSVAANGKTISWDVPAGDSWQIMAFHLVYTGQECQAQSAKNPPAMIIDHLSRGAVERNCAHLGGILKATVGDEFGKTVDSFFCDSFEISPPKGGLLWSTDTLANFAPHAGYDLTKYLPALWYDIGPLTPRVRYDLGEYLHHQAMDNLFRPFNAWCAEQGVQARVQAHYRFMEELVEGAGSVARPETEATTARFEPVADPRKAEASGARFYGNAILSAEAYTFIHPARYRTDMQDIKIATDAFWRDGITQFYNHGYFASPEMHVSPARDMPWANRISHWNVWWPYYHCLAQYVARGCSILRQGKLVADVLIYAPQATAWSERAIWGMDRRVLPYGNLAKTLVANGYDFDIVNDDLLTNAAKFQDGKIEINGHVRSVLILPRATVLPIETMRAIDKFSAGGGLVIAVEELPAAAAGMKNFEKNDLELKSLVQKTFAKNGRGLFLPEYKLSREPFNPMRQPYQVTAPLENPQRQLLAAIERVQLPDFVPVDRSQSDGLTFIHKSVDAVDVYLVTNLQPKTIAKDVIFRVKGKNLQRWDAITGVMKSIPDAKEVANGTQISLDFAPWESAFFVFVPSDKPKEDTRRFAESVSIPLNGTWQMKLEGFGFETYSAPMTKLASWTNSPRTAHFSGVGVYSTEFNLTESQIPAGAQVILDLGQVGNLADVQLNGKDVGVAWMAPHRLEIGEGFRIGQNTLVIKVANTLINYVTGLKTTPEIAPELQGRLGKANPSIYTNSKLEKKEMNETDLPPSGLIGPVQLRIRAPIAQ